MDELVNFYSHTFEQQGLNPLLGKIFALLTTETEPVSLTDIAKKLNLSKAAISIHVRVLNQMGYCRKIPRGSDRMDYYVLNDNYIEMVFSNAMRLRRFSVEELNRIIRSHENKQSSQVIDRLKELKAFEQFMCELEDDLMAKWIEYKKC